MGPEIDGNNFPYLFHYVQWKGNKKIKIKKLKIRAIKIGYSTVFLIEWL